MEHKISTQHGQSGSPLILIEKTQSEDELSIIAIHKGSLVTKEGKQENRINVACMLTKDIISLLQKEAAKMGA